MKLVSGIRKLMDAAVRSCARIAQVVRKEWKDCAIIFALFLLPAAVFFLYVGAYIDPLGNIDNTRVLIVNMDDGDAGKNVENAIRATNLYEFRSATYEYAQSEIASGNEYAAIVIPAGFSDRIENGEKAQIVLLTDDSRSYIVTKMLTSTVGIIASRLDAQIKLKTAEQISEGAGQIASQERMSAAQLALLSNASGKLANGSRIVSASSSSGALGLSELSSSEYALASGTRTASYGADNLHDGLVLLENGSSRIANGAATLGNGTSNLVVLHSNLNSLISQSLQAAQAANQTSIAYALTIAQNLSTIEYAGLKQANASVWQLQDGAEEVTSGISSAAGAANTLSYGLGEGYHSTLNAAAATDSAALGLTQASEATNLIANGNAQVSDSLSLLSTKENALASASSSVSDASDSNAGVSLIVKESNKADYGTFFATTFVILGLFLGTASAYLFASLSRIRKPLLFALSVALVQTLALVIVYSSMGFPSRGGEMTLALVLFTAAALFVLLVRFIASVISSKLSYEHLQYLSPVLSLLAIFMISSGGTIWPSQTLAAPFSSFAPFIPFSYAVSAVRATALRAEFPFASLTALALFGVAFVLLAWAFDKARTATTKNRLYT